MGQKLPEKPGRTGLMTSGEDLICAFVRLQMKCVSLLKSSRYFVDL